MLDYPSISLVSVEVGMLDYSNISSISLVWRWMDMLCCPLPERRTLHYRLQQWWDTWSSSAV